MKKIIFYRKSNKFDLPVKNCIYMINAYLIFKNILFMAGQVLCLPSCKISPKNEET
jgi:hypothetical protein